MRSASLPSWRRWGGRWRQRFTASARRAAMKKPRISPMLRISTGQLCPAHCERKRIKKFKIFLAVASRSSHAPYLFPREQPRNLSFASLPFAFVFDQRLRLDLVSFERDVADPFFQADAGLLLALTLLSRVANDIVLED